MGLAMEQLDKIKTENGLLIKLQRSTSAHPSSQELFEQRVSFVLGAIDSESNVTRDQVRRILEQEAGTASDSPRTNGD